MTTLGFCTHFSNTDEWAFEYAFRLVQARDWQLNICHWLSSPFLLRRDLVQDDLFQSDGIQAVTPQLLNKLDLQRREHYDSKLGDFTNVAFKLCEGQFQVELVRCLRRNQLDLIVMGYMPVEEVQEPGVQPLDEFAYRLSYPVILVGRDGPHSFLLNAKALEWLEYLDIPQGDWTLLEPQKV